MEVFFEDVKPPSPASVRLGRWLFYDTRLSADNTVACASCHKPEYAFSEPTPVSTGIKGQKGGRKAPTFINKAVTLAPHFFWDGRAKLARGSGARPDRQSDRDGQHARGDDRHAVARAGLQAVLQGSLRHRRDHQGARGAGDCRLRAHARQRQLTVRPLAVQSRAERGVGRGEARPRSVLRHRRLRAVPHRQQLQRQPVSQPRRRLGSEDEDVQGRGPLRDHEEARGPRRVQDAGAARRQQAPAVHARRLDRDAARSRRAVQQGRHREPVSDARAGSSRSG